MKVIANSQHFPKGCPGSDVSQRYASKTGVSSSITQQGKCKILVAAEGQVLFIRFLMLNYSY